MRTKSFTLWIAFLTLISLVVLVYILTNINPNNTTVLSFILFYLVFFIATAGLFTLAVPKISLRQGILISIIFTGFLLLQSVRNLNWLTGGLVVLIALAIELFLAKK